jgi:hypothetical protein
MGRRWGLKDEPQFFQTLDLRGAAKKKLLLSNSNMWFVAFVYLAPLLSCSVSLKGLKINLKFALVTDPQA